MNTLQERELVYLCQTLDTLSNLDVFGKGVIEPMYKAAVANQEAPLSLFAARLIMESVQRNDTVLVATGFPERAWIARPVAETDGPVGAATLARGIHLALEAIPVVLIDEAFVPLMEACCRAAGLVALDIQYLDNVRREGGFQSAFVVGIPSERAAGSKLCDEILKRLNPSLAIAIERPGMNEKGVYHQVFGSAIPDDAVADLDHLFRNCQKKGITTIGIGDGGNEIGMGVIREDLKKIRPEMRRCSCPCDGGSAAVTKTDALMTAAISNWGATAIQAALALLTSNEAALHNPAHDKRIIEACNASGGVDGGITFGTEPAVDDVALPAYSAITALALDIIKRTLRA